MRAGNPPLTPLQIGALLEPFLQNSHAAAGSSCLTTEILFEQLAVYLDLLIRWNRRTNLTSIADPEEIVRRHFGESLFLAQQIAPQVVDVGSIVDFGSGAGFPGLPAKLMCPHWPIVLAESQHKKVSFLREVIRILGVKCEVWPNRVEAWPAQTPVAITMRAVDSMRDAVFVALRFRPALIAILTSTSLAPKLQRTPAYNATVLLVPTRPYQALVILNRASDEAVLRSTWNRALGRSSLA